MYYYMGVMPPVKVPSDLIVLCKVLILLVGVLELLSFFSLFLAQ